MTFEQSVDAKLKRSWLLEEVSPKSKPWTPEQMEVCNSLKIPFQDRQK